MPELSEDIKREIIGELYRDSQRLGNQVQLLRAEKLEWRELEQLTYLTEQIRLKLRMIGAPRID